MTAVASASTGRLVRIEIKRSAAVWALPLLAALFLIDPFRTASGQPAIWDVRASVVLNRMLLDFVTFAAAFAAWAGSREGRRRITDLVASLFVLPFLAGVAALYVQTARVATWGGPPLWPVAVSVVTLTAVCAVGFAAGALFPGRFTAPLVAVGVFILEHIAFKGAVAQSGKWALLSPSTTVPPNDAGVFYPVDRPISYIPVCAGTGFQVCVHPAFSRYLDDTAAALAPVAAEITGLPGAPVRGEEVNSAAQASTGVFGVVTGNPPVYQFSMNTMLDLSGSQETNFREGFLDAFAAPDVARNANGNGPPSYAPAQQAVAVALMQTAGSRPTPNSLFAFGPDAASQTQIAAAADRFAALPPAARHAWLATHLTALQSGHITLEQLP
jgi:hypothetical protein